MNKLSFKGLIIIYNMDNQSNVASPIFADNPLDSQKKSVPQLVPSVEPVPVVAIATPSGEWSARQIVLATLTAIGVVFIFLLLYRFYMVVFIFFVAVTLQIGLRPAIDWLERRGIRRDLALILVFALLFGLVGGFIWFAVPLLIGQVNTIGQQLPSYYANFYNYLVNSHSGLLQVLAASLPAKFPLSLSAVTAATSGATIDTITPAWQFVTSLSYMIFVAIVIFMLAFYWTTEGDLITRRFLLLAPQAHRDELRDLLGEIEIKVGAYFRGEAILCGIIALLSMAAFFVIGVPYFFALGLVMGLCEAIPTFGPTLGAIPVVLITLNTAPEKVVWVIVAIAITQFLESHFIVPRVMDRSLGVNAVVTLLAIAGFGVLLGIGGAILAIPLAAILQILLNRLVFNVPITEEAPKPVVVTEDLERNRISVLRLETQELMHDVRKRVRNDEETMPNADNERAEDLLEAIALDLDGLLTERENRENAANRTANQNGLLTHMEGIA